ncbi:MAG TPA: hypothetical protein VKF37_10170 [Chloroflexota bacterium]|nr:hypothetical protein [Chloroflexota bacterium]
MDLIIRRSPIVTKAESEETLAEAINVGYVHALLYQRGEAELADLLAAHVRPQEARGLAWHLRQFVRKATRTSIFQDYRTRLSPADARAIRLAAAWYERAGAAGCRIWADLRDQVRDLAPARQPLPYPAPEPICGPAALSLEEADRDGGDGGERPGAVDPVGDADSLMPTWLHAPDTSVWNQ